VAQRNYSVAEARQNLPRLIRDAERGRAVQITRRGEPVAVLLSASGYRALAGERTSFVATVRALRARHAVERLGIGEQEFQGLRDPAPGRRVSL
jgi:prevent-host-death family protein